jgi:cytochrome c553
MTRPLPIAASLALALFATSAHGQEATSQPDAPAAAQASPAALQGNAENGRMLTYTCQGCHGIEGYKNAYPNYHVPMIGGQSTTYLINALNGYRDGTRKHPTMRAQAQSFSDQDIADIATFLSGLTQ